MVAFHFPPQTGSSGILRSLNFVKYLPAKGWHCTVLTASPNAYVQQRNDLVSSIPAETVLVRAAAFDAARHLAIKGKYLRLSALPDRWASWCVPAVLAGLREIRRDRPNIIWSTYPIATAHLIGGALARLTGIPWVADFRDPMVAASYPEDQMQRKIAEWLEPRVMKRSAACVFTTDRAAQNYKRKYPEFADKCQVIENGYDDEAFEAADILALAPKSDEILMLHSGAIYPSDRDPSSFFGAVRTLIDNGEIDSTKLSIRFRAPGHGDDVMVCAKRYGVGSLVQLAPPIPYHEAIVEMMSANLLLVFQGKNFNSQVPAKIYEYVRAKRPILAITDPEGETFRQLQQFNCIWQADIASVGSVSKAMLSWINAGRTPESESLLMQNLEIVRRYSRKAGAERLGELFHSIHKRTDRAD